MGTCHANLFWTCWQTIFAINIELYRLEWHGLYCSEKILTHICATDYYHIIFHAIMIRMMIKDDHFCRKKLRDVWSVLIHRLSILYLVLGALVAMTCRCSNEGPLVLVNNIELMQDKWAVRTVVIGHVHCHIGCHDILVYPDSKSCICK